MATPTTDRDNNKSIEVKVSPPGEGSIATTRSPRRYWIRDVLEFATEDTNRVTFSLKVGLACLLVSLLILIRHPYRVFGTNMIWALITVAIMFEYTVGATFNRGLNRALGSLFAGIFAVVFMQIAASSGSIAAPYIIGFSIFLVGAITSFMKLWPSLVPYEYGFRVILFTYCLIIATGYRVSDPLRTAVDRLYSIAIGGVVAVLVNILIFPIWAGEQLHKELVEHFHLVADSLEECVEKYLNDDETGRPEFLKAAIDDFHDESAYRKCRAILTSSTNLDSLAASAKWEPPHGGFRHFSYPWREYVSVGAVLRHCAYEVMAMHGCLRSQTQAPYGLRRAFRADILETASQAAELVRSLSQDIRNMTHRLYSAPLNHVHSSAERLQQRSIDLQPFLLASSSGGNFGGDNSTVAVAAAGHAQRRRRLRSWPSIEQQAEEEGAESTERRACGCRCNGAAALSVATFASLLVEFVARLDRLVESVDRLGRLAKFKQEIAWR